MGGCTWPRHKALRYYLTSASTSNEDLVKYVYIGQEFAVNNIVRFYGSVTTRVPDRDPQ